jgi:hypothetical protein
MAPLVLCALLALNVDEPQSLRFSRLRRTSDGFFLKVSYLFRL